MTCRNPSRISCEFVASVGFVAEWPHYCLQTLLAMELFEESRVLLSMKIQFLQAKLINIYKPVFGGSWISICSSSILVMASSVSVSVWKWTDGEGVAKSLEVVLLWLDSIMAVTKWLEDLLTGMSSWSWIGDGLSSSRWLESSYLFSRKIVLFRVLSYLHFYAKPHNSKVCKNLFNLLTYYIYL